MFCRTTTKILQVVPSKYHKKSHTSIDSNRIDDMFEDSNDSFEIPETQTDPPRDHMNDELDSEGFIAMPAEEMESIDCLQSQVVLQGIESVNRSLNGDEFDDSDNIDLEMSKLQWDDSAKDNDKNKSASVTPELDLQLLAQPAVSAFTVSTSFTTHSDLEELSSTITNVIQSLDSPKVFKQPNQSPFSHRKEVR